jgi:hypothetical protein
MTREEALDALAERIARSNLNTAPPVDICDWMEKRYYLAPGSSTESNLRFSVPIRLMPHQKVILRLQFHNPLLNVVTSMYSTVKKSGKTAIGGGVARYKAENSGFYAEIYCLANDEEQARGRIYKAAVDSIENTPYYDEHHKILPMSDARRRILHEMYGQRASSVPQEWRIIERQAEYTPTKSFIRALSSDYRGEAGANPTASVWSEIWGLDSEKSKKLWAELTPAPTRPSIRFVETYAGYEDESIILEELWDLAMQGRQLTRDDLRGLTSTTGYSLEWPEDEPGYRGHPDKLPLWINENASLCAYIDQGVEARRMPWQKGPAGEAYYKEEEQTLEPIQNRRFHENEWTSTISPFIDVMWWRNCSIRQWVSTGGIEGRWGDVCPDTKPMDSIYVESASTITTFIRTSTKKIPLVLAGDAAVTSDYMAVSVTSREGPHTVGFRGLRVWKPEDYASGKLDYETTIVEFVKRMCKDFNVVEFCFDPYQLHKVATDLEHEFVCACYPFNQNSERLKADKQLHDLIRDRELIYDPLLDPDLLGPNGLEAFETALRWCAMKQSKDEDTKYRIIKKSAKAKIDPVVALSMGAERTLYLNLW